MYTDFYHLTKKPFDLTPSLQFLYLSENHREALSILSHGVIEGQSFIVLTGEVGAGKTTIVQALLAKLEKGIEYVHISNPILTPEEFIDYLAFSAFHREPQYESKADFLSEFESCLKEWRKKGKTFLLVVDEAHTLSFELIEEIRLLSNLTFANGNSINIILVGQPELNEKLEDPGCKALLQRIKSRYDISPLDLKDVRNYMWTRLRVAGVRNPNNIFSSGAVGAIYKYSKGYPRMVNIISDNCLLLGFSKGKRKITASIVENSYRDMQLEIPSEEVEEVSLASLTHVDEEEKSIDRRGPSPYLKWVLASLLVSVIIAFNFSQKGGKLFGELLNTLLVDRRQAVEVTTSENLMKPIVRHDISRDLDRIGIDDREKPKEETVDGKNGPNEVSRVQKESEGPTETPMKTEPDTQPKDEVKAPDNPVPSKEPDQAETPQRAPEKDFLFFRPLIIKRGDTLSKLALQIYGHFDKALLHLIGEYNPGINDMDLIMVGQKLILPLSRFSRENSIYTVHIASFKLFEVAEEFSLGVVKKGYESYIIPTDYAQKEEIFRVTIGHFENIEEAKGYATTIIENKVFYYAEIIKLGG